MTVIAPSVPRHLSTLLGVRSSLVHKLGARMCRGSAKRSITHMMWQRVLASKLAHDNGKVTIALSLAAREAFAKSSGKCILIEDLPDFATLASDLKRAQELYPQSPFLSNVEPPAWAIKRQRAERLLADEIWYWRDFTWAAVVPHHRDKLVKVEVKPSSPVVICKRYSGQNKRVLIAGGGQARAGAHIANKLSQELPGCIFYSRFGEGHELSDAIEKIHPGETICPDAVISLSLVETEAPEVLVAREKEIPTIVNWSRGKILGKDTESIKSQLASLLS